jgi:glycerophosphoryl diester phosphodiesterase
MMPPPIVIAHRGASGYLPEHTLAAKALAHGFRSDYLEQDVVATRDSELVVLHDVFLDDVTDVARRFPDRRRADGRYYVVDFDLAELKTLTVFERRAPGSSAPKYPARFPSGSGLFEISTLREELELIHGLNRSTGRVAGIYPEIKEPAWHRQHGIDVAQLLLAELEAFGYSKPEHAVFVQCFDQAELLRVRNELGCALRLIQLMGPEPEYATLATPAGLASVASYAQGIGPHYSQLIEAASQPTRASDVMRRAREVGLCVHAYTFRQDDWPAYARSFEELLELFLGELAVDGVFCDHPDVAIRVRDSLQKVQTAPSSR